MGRVITYIDGFNLYYGMREAYGRKYMWLNLVALSEKLLMPHQTLVHCHYFTAKVRFPQSKQRRQNKYLEALDTLSPNISITFGKYYQQDVECPQCLGIYQKSFEKMTDVNIASQMIVDAFDDVCDTFLLISGDSDLSSPIQHIKRKFPKKRIIIEFPPMRNSSELKRVADGHYLINETTLRHCQFSEFITKPDGYQLQRPQSWH